MIDKASWQEGYDVGHIDGESSCAAAWCTALSEVLPNGFDLTPSTVAAEIARLRALGVADAARPLAALWQTRAEAQAAENARLRAALEWMVGLTIWQDGPGFIPASMSHMKAYAAAKAMQAAADAALRGEEGA